MMVDGGADGNPIGFEDFDGDEGFSLMKKTCTTRLATSGRVSGDVVPRC